LGGGEAREEKGGALWGEIIKKGRDWGLSTRIKNESKTGGRKENLPLFLKRKGKEQSEGDRVCDTDQVGATQKLLVKIEYGGE